MTNNYLPDAIQRAASIVDEGGIIVYPTETVYGIGCDPRNKLVCDEIRNIKGRGDDKPFLLIAADMQQIIKITRNLAEPARKLALAFWPGPLTIVLPVQSEELSHLTGPTGGIAFRVSSHPVAAGIAMTYEYPIVSTSANKTGELATTTYLEAVATFGTLVDMVIEDNVSRIGVPSTIVDCTSDSPAILREGALLKDSIMKALYA